MDKRQAEFIDRPVVPFVMGPSRRFIGGDEGAALVLALDDFLPVGVLEVTLGIGF
jgi:hypothetical protein